ncbi:CTP synthase (UTP-ammonia lyase) [Streptosporangium becharense]|uniref:CTP synthase (glutamine hydrolyzing) n=1 Tax=Streptosporangium becharense TaxID=1816182 RepID=A0A7W9ILQ5_9ACTN|nr:CTP synthase [Streptosporangium becharense]MBB2910173.1 CTP synthase (UTP-ammonia lyase) [Streptosporangium becharense]MBB5822916.1 CTP synthase (UTP-ammonia lyase) [Streptosporangium becharense]
MHRPLTVAVIGDSDETSASYLTTNDALRHSAGHLGVEVDIRWLPTPPLETDLSAVRSADALWCAPGSPYRSLSGALRAMRHGREHGIPTLGTCGGYQHIVIEYARNVLGFTDAQHAEYDPYASRLFVSRLACSLVGKTMPVMLVPGSTAAALYGEEKVEEEYYCNFGLNPDHQRTLHDGGLRVIGTDADGEARILQVPGHPFYLATLFLPQARSSSAGPHPLITGFLRAALKA